MFHTRRIAITCGFVALLVTAAVAALTTPATGFAGIRVLADYPVYHVKDSVIGVRLRHSPHATDTYPNGVGPHDGDAFQLVCQDWGDPMGTRDNHIWDYIYWAGYAAWIPDVWTDTPGLANQYSYTHPCPGSVGGTGGSGGAVTAPGSVTVSGTVVCGSGQSVVGVWVDATGGGSGWASWQPMPGMPYAAYYSRGVRTGSVSLHVGCGGSPQRWGGDNRTPYAGVSGDRTLNTVCSDGAGVGTRCIWPPTGLTRNWNPGVARNCTWEASQMMYDAIGRYPGWNGDAISWATNAARAGWLVRAEPMAHTIFVMPYGVGHVGWVDSVEYRPDGVYIHTTEMNSYGNLDGKVYNLVRKNNSAMRYILVP